MEHLKWIGSGRREESILRAAKTMQKDNEPSIIRFIL